MLFRLSKKNAPEKAVRLRVFCPRLEGGDFAMLSERVLEAAARGAKGNGASRVPTAVVFGEYALKNPFGISDREVWVEIARLQQRLRGLDNDVSVAFSVYERRVDWLDQGMVEGDPHGEREHAHNRSYLVSAHGISDGPKRFYACQSDKLLVERFWTPVGEADYQLKVWWIRGQHYEENYAFPHRRLDNGLTLELRVCNDVDAKPLWKAHDMVSLVPAHALESNAELLAGRRMAVVVNDSWIDPNTRQRPSNLWTPGKGATGAKQMREIGIEVEII